MSKLLYIEASPRKSRSKSIAVAKTFLDAYRAANPGDAVVTIDLWEKNCLSLMATPSMLNTKCCMVRVLIRNKRPLGMRWWRSARNSNPQTNTSSVYRCGTLEFLTN